MNKIIKKRGDTVKIYTRGGQFFADGFAIRRSFSLEEGESRLISYVSDAGCGAATASVVQGEILVEGKIGVIRWKRGAELFPLPAVHPWEETAEKVVSALSEKTCVRVRGGILSEIEITGAVKYKHRTSCLIHEPKISVIDNQRSPIVKIDAACDAGSYVALFSLAEGGVERLLEECGDSILCEGNEVRIERRFDDMLARHATLRCLWQGDRFTYSREIVCANEHIFIREESGRALLEAAMARDEKAMRALLSPGIGDPRAILDYLGEILAVRPALGSDSPTAAAAIIRDDKGLKAITYDFEFDEKGRIKNILNDE